jgi:hypothetical protein
LFSDPVLVLNDTFLRFATIFGQLKIWEKQARQCAYNLTLRHVRTTIVAVEKQCVTYSGCAFVALGIRHAMRMRHIVICGLPGPTKFFPRYLINGTIFGGGGIY